MTYRAEHTVGIIICVLCVRNWNERLCDQVIYLDAYLPLLPLTQCSNSFVIAFLDKNTTTEDIIFFKLEVTSLKKKSDNDNLLLCPQETQGVTLSEGFVSFGTHRAVVISRKCGDLSIGQWGHS